MKAIQELSLAIIDLIPLFDKHFARSFEVEARKTCSGSQLKILLLLENLALKPSMTELAHLLEISKAQLTSVIENLVQMGFVRRGLNEHDRRRIEIQVTASGHQFLKQIKTEMVQIYNTRLMALEEADQDQFYQAISQLTELCNKLN